MLLKMCFHSPVDSLKSNNGYYCLWTLINEKRVELATVVCNFFNSEIQFLKNTGGPYRLGGKELLQFFSVHLCLVQFIESLFNELVSCTNQNLAIKLCCLSDNRHFHITSFTMPNMSSHRYRMSYLQAFRRFRFRRFAKGRSLRRPSVYRPDS